MNYASVVFAGFAAISVVWYFIRGRKAFTGPPVPADVDISSDIGVVSGQAVESDLEKSTSAVHRKMADDPPKMM